MWHIDNPLIMAAFAEVIKRTLALFGFIVQGCFWLMRHNKVETLAVSESLVLMNRMCYEHIFLANEKLFNSDET